MCISIVPDLSQAQREWANEITTWIIQNKLLYSGPNAVDQFCNSLLLHLQNFGGQVTGNNTLQNIASVLLSQVSLYIYICSSVLHSSVRSFVCLYCIHNMYYCNCIHLFVCSSLLCQVFVRSSVLCYVCLFVLLYCVVCVCLFVCCVQSAFIVCSIRQLMKAMLTSCTGN